MFYKKTASLAFDFGGFDIDGKIRYTYLEKNPETAPTGKVMWFLGGQGDEFGLKENQKFYGQHSVSFLSDDSILLYDNGRNNKAFRVLIIKLDEKNKKILKFREFVLEDFSLTMDSVQVIDEEKNIYLICYGESMGATKSIEEVNLDIKEIYFSFRFELSPILYNVNKF